MGQGPALCSRVTAGVNGYEYTPILTDPALVIARGFELLEYLLGMGEISGPLESRASYDFSPASQKSSVR